MRGLLPLWVGIVIYASVSAGRKPAADRSRYACGRSRSGNGSSTITRCRKPMSIPSPCAASPGFRRSGWRRCSTPRPMPSPAGAGRWCWRPPRSRRPSRCWRDFSIRHLSDSTALVFVAAALALTVPHLLARPHVLALPVMVPWVGGLIAAADRRGAPSFWLLPLMALWANLHGGFVFGLVLIAPIALDAVINADAQLRKSLALRWAAFGARGAAGELLHALWLEFAVGVAEDPRARQRAAADQGMAGGGFQQPRCARNLPAAAARARAVARHQAAADAHRAAARSDSHGAGPGTAPPKSWRCWRRWCLPPRWRGRSAALRFPVARRRSADARRAARRRRGRAGGGNACLCARCIASRRTCAARRSRRWPS